MNKLLLILGLGFITSLAWGQNAKEKDGFNMPNGVRFGWLSSKYLQDGDSSGNALDRGYIGYVRKISILRLLKLETGLEYMIAGTNLDEDKRIQLHYLVVPAQGALKLGPFITQAGLSANFKIVEDFTENGEEIERPDDEKASNFDLAANVAAGFSFLFATFEVRHYWGLLEVEDGWHTDYWQAGLKLNF